MKTKPKLEKPNDADRAWHQETGGLYPLAGVMVLNGERRIVEQLEPRPRKDWPMYEVHAPQGRRLVDGTHSHLCFDAADLWEYGTEDSEPDPYPEAEYAPAMHRVMRGIIAKS